MDDLMDDLINKFNNLQIEWKKISTCLESQSISVDNLTDKLNNLQISNNCEAKTKKSNYIEICKIKGKYLATNSKHYCGTHIKQHTCVDKNGKIYFVFSLKDGQIVYSYIGQTIKPLKQRLIQHGKSKNKCATKIYRNNGETYIYMILLEENISTKEIHSKEQSWMDKFRDMGYTNFMNKIMKERIQIEQKVHCINLKTNYYETKKFNKKYLYDSSCKKNHESYKLYKLINLQKACK